ncbi:MAG: SMC-Scp complex subunit ScpB [Planctomycetota bacterium]
MDESNQENEPGEEAEELDLFSQLQAGDTSNDDDEAEGVSLEEISQSYADVISQNASEPDEELNPIDAEGSEQAPIAGEESALEVLTSPRSIIESVLFVGRPDGSGIRAPELAKLMRGVTEEEVLQHIRELNDIYAHSQRAMHIDEQPDGFRMELRPQLENVRESFYGPTREISLNQSAIDCLALVAYQPGISRDKLEEQRGQPSGGVLNQLVRRSLIEMRREVPEGMKKKVPHYYPTQKLVELTGMTSVEDLPQVEDLDIE